MIRLITLALVIVALTACRKDLTSDAPVQDAIDTTTAITKYSGNFINGPYGAVSGSAKIVADSSFYKVALVNVQITNGPDLHVYLSREREPIHFIDLGKLKSTSGTQLYSLTSIPDFTQYKYVLVHCQKFNHLFGSAEIEP